LKKLGKYDILDTVKKWKLLFMNLRLCAFADEAEKDLFGQIEALKRNEISLLELRNVNGKNVSDLTDDECHYIKKELNKKSIKIWSLGSSLGKSNLDDENNISKCKRLLEIAKILGTERIRIFSFYNANEQESKVIEKLNIFLQLARKQGITLCHENEKEIFGDTPKKCEKIFEKLPLLRGVFDPANFIQCGVTNTLEAYKKLQKRIEYLHIKDATADGLVVPSGNGIGNIKELIKLFAQNEPNGVISIEPHLSATPSNEAFDTAVKSVKNILKI